eukprot:gene356-8718_t
MAAGPPPLPPPPPPRATPPPQAPPQAQHMQPASQWQQPSLAGQQAPPPPPIMQLPPQLLPQFVAQVQQQLMGKGGAFPPLSFLHPFGPQPSPMPGMVQAVPSTGAPPPTPPPIERQEGARAEAPFVAPAAAARQLRRLAGTWYSTDRGGRAWRLAVPETGTYVYTYEEVGADRRGRREFGFSVRGSLCRAGQELLRLETTEDLVTGKADTVAAEWAVGAVWSRCDPREVADAADPPSRGSARASPRRRRRSPPVRFTIRVPPRR